MYTYILHREYFLILRFEFSKFSRLKSWLYYYRTHARSKWEILQPSLDLTIAKKRLRKMQLGIILISQGGRIVFFDECSMYIFVEDFFFGWVCLFLRIEKSMKQKGGRKKNCARKFLQQMFSEILFLRLLIYFQGHLFDQKSSISTFNRFITWHVCCCLFSSKKMYAS